MIIHQLAPSDKNKWHPTWKMCHSSISKLPYKIKIWNDEEINNELKKDDEYFYNKYLSILDPIYKWDYIRYIILERYGGAYLDMDIEIKFNFFPLLNNNIIYILEGKHEEYLQNSIIISPPTHHVLWNGIKEWCKINIINNFDECKSNVINTIKMVGPQAISNYFARNNIPFEMLSYHHFSKLDSKLSLAIHHQTSNWYN